MSPEDRWKHEFMSQLVSESMLLQNHRDGEWFQKLEMRFAQLGGWPEFERLQRELFKAGYTLEEQDAYTPRFFRDVYFKQFMRLGVLPMDPHKA